MIKINGYELSESFFLSDKEFNYVSSIKIVYGVSAKAMLRCQRCMVHIINYTNEAYEDEYICFSIDRSISEYISDLPCDEVILKNILE